MLKGRRIAAMTMAVAAVAVVTGGCNNSSARSVSTFCAAVKKNTNALNRPAVGVGVDNQGLLQANVNAFHTVATKAPDEISEQTAYIEKATRSFFTQWKANQFKTGSMPDFDEKVAGKYTEFDQYVSQNCNVNLSAQ
jgi:hypothetical protein